MTATVSVGPGRPSAHYPASERALNGATDYDVTITVGAAVVQGGITLYTDKVNGGMSSGGSPLDVWCSASVATFVRGLARGPRSAVLASLEARAESDDIEIEEN